MERHSSVGHYVVVELRHHLLRSDDEYIISVYWSSRSSLYPKLMITALVSPAVNLGGTGTALDWTGIVAVSWVHLAAKSPHPRAISVAVTASVDKTSFCSRNCSGRERAEREDFSEMGCMSGAPE